MTGGTNVEKLFQALDGHSFWGYKLFAIPMYLFLLLAFTVITANQLDIIPSSMVGSIGAMFIIGIVMGAVSYTHLDVYKRQLRIVVDHGFGQNLVLRMAPGVL